VTDAALTRSATRYPKSSPAGAREALESSLRGCARRTRVRRTTRRHSASDVEHGLAVEVRTTLGAAELGHTGRARRPGGRPRHHHGRARPTYRCHGDFVSGPVSPWWDGGLQSCLASDRQTGSGGPRRNRVVSDHSMAPPTARCWPALPCIAGTNAASASLLNPLLVFGLNFRGRRFLLLFLLCNLASDVA
jgi:hypothetical protein